MQRKVVFMSLIIAISGYSGGKQGPNRVYSHLQNFSTGEGPFTIFPIETLPNSIQKNVDLVTEIALENFKNYECIYLIGYSMGGAVAVQAAYDLNQKIEGLVKGKIFISTQTDGLNVLKNLDLPVLFYHGKEDRDIRFWEAEYVYDSYTGIKKMIIVEGLDHCLATENSYSKSKEFSLKIASDIYSEISEFFAKPQEKNEVSAKAIHKIIPLNPNPLFSWDRVTSIFRSFN